MNIQLFERLKCDGQTHKNDLNEVLSKIRELFNSKDKWQQLQGLCLLNVIVKKSKIDVLDEYATSWIRQVMQVISTFPVDSILKLCFSIVIHLLKRSAGFDKLSREIALKTVEPFLVIVLEPNLDVICETFILLSTCIQYYPGPCGRYYNDIEKLIMSALFSSHEAVSISASSCFPLLALCGSGGERRIKHAECYELLFKRVLKTILHLTLSLSDNLMGKERHLFNDIDMKLLILPPLEDNVTGILPHTCLHLTRLLFVVTAFITQPIPFKIDFPINHLITLFMTVSELTHITISETHKRLGVDASISRILNELQKSICYSIHQFSTLLLPYSYVLLKLIFVGFSRDSCSVNAYKSLGIVFTKWKGIASRSTFVEEVLKYVIADLRYDSSDNLVLINVESSKKKKKKNNLSQMIQEELNNSTYQEPATNLQEQRAFSALKLLEILLNNSGSILEGSCLKLIINYIFSALQLIYSVNNMTATIYSNNHVRKMLFQNVNALVNLNHHSVKVPVSSLLMLFHMGAKDECCLVSEYCEVCLTMCDTKIHSSNPSFRNEASEKSDAKEQAITMLQVKKDNLEKQNLFKLFQQDLVNVKGPSTVQENLGSKFSESSEVVLENNDRLDGLNSTQNAKYLQPSQDSVTPSEMPHLTDIPSNQQNSILVVDSSEEENNIECVPLLTTRKRNRSQSEDKEYNSVVKKVSSSAKITDDDQAVLIESQEVNEILSSFFEE